MRKIERLLIAVPLCFTLLVGFFSWNAYRTAPRIAAENLKGAALTISSAIEQLAAVDADFTRLASYTTPDIAYFSLSDHQGITRFHTNRSLIGTTLPEPVTDRKLHDGIIEERKTLGTGEEIYLLQTHVHPNGNDYLLTLALHTYRADAVIRRAKSVVGMVVFLTMSLLLVTCVVFLLLRREERHRVEMRRREELARLGELGAVMAHEIRNPLAGIKGFAQLVEEATELDQARLYADRIVSQSLRMETLVNDLLSFAREDGNERQMIDLAELVRDCVTLISQEAASARVSITCELHEIVTVIVDADRIIQLILNLMKNSLQAMPDGGELSVCLEKHKKDAVISVQDSGIGISPENLPHIFEPFWTSKARGTGLGLALCRKIAEEHGGQLSVATVAGTGTTFTLSLPLEE